MTLYFCPDCSTYTYHTTDEDEVATCEQCGCETVLNTTPWHKKPPTGGTPCAIGL
jgi:hypothetical protein